MLAGHLEDAQALAEHALELTRALKARGNEAYALRLLGEIAVHRHPSERTGAEAHYRQALALANELGMRPLVAHCHCGLGTLYAQTGQREQARTALATARARPGHGHDLLAAPGGGGAGAGGTTMTLRKAIGARRVAQRPVPGDWQGAGGESPRSSRQGCVSRKVEVLPPSIAHSDG